MQRIATVAPLLLAAALATSLLAQSPEPAAPPAAPKKFDKATGIELAHPGTLQEYIDRYTGKDVGCTIGGQTFRNFHIRTQSSVVETELNGRPHPMPPMTPDQIFLTPVNYVKDGRRWIGFRYTTLGQGVGHEGGGWNIVGPDLEPSDFPYKKGHDIKNAGFTTNYDIMFEAHGTSPWERGKVAYVGLATEKLVDGKWNESANTGPGSRGNLGWYPRTIGAYGSASGYNPKTPQSGAWARLSSISRALNPDAKAPTSNENWILFNPAKPVTSFETRAGKWNDYSGEHAPHLYTYGMWFRINCWGKHPTRWHADYIEWGFSNASLTDEVWTADGKNKAAPPEPLPASKIPLPKEPLPVATPSGKTMTLDCGNGVTLKLVEIPAGKFIMGSPDNEKGRLDNEGPQRVVTITRPFYLGVTEVTQAQFAAVFAKPPAEKTDDEAAEKPAEKPQDTKKARPQISHGPGSVYGGPDHPVDNVRRPTAERFIKALAAKTGKKIRLPSEAEWEYAARAGTITPYTFGDDPQQLADYATVLNPGEAGDRGTSEVAKKKPNPWGLYDMYGNVWEWTSDIYTKNYVDAPDTDPHNATGEVPTLRGGSWSYPADYARSASRLLGSPNDTADGGTTGFRILVEAEDAK